MDVSSPPCRESGPHSPEWHLDTPGSMLAMGPPRLSVPTPPSRPVKSRLSTTSSLPSDVLAASSCGYGYGTGTGSGGLVVEAATHAANGHDDNDDIEGACDARQSEGGGGFDRAKWYNLFLVEIKNLESTMHTRLSATEAKYAQAAHSEDVHRLHREMQEMRNELEEKLREQEQNINEQRALANLLGSDVSALQASKRQHVAAASMMSEIFESVGGLRSSLSELSRKREESDTALWRLEQSTTSNQEALAAALRQLQSEVLNLKRSPSLVSSPSKSFLTNNTNEDDETQKELEVLRKEVKALRKDVEAAPWRETVVTVLSEMQSELLGMNNRNQALDKRVADEMSALKSSVSMASTACVTEEKSERTVKPMSQDLSDLKELVLQEASKQQNWTRMFQSSLESTSSQVAVHEEKIDEMKDILGHHLAEQHDKISGFGQSIADLKYATEHLLRQDALKDNTPNSDDEGNVSTPRPKGTPDKRKQQKIDDIASVQEVLTKEVTAISTRLAVLEKQKHTPPPVQSPAPVVAAAAAAASKPVAYTTGRPHSTPPPGLLSSEEVTRHRLLSASTLAAASSPHMSSTCPPATVIRPAGGVVRSNIMVPKLNLQHGGSPNGGAATVRLPATPLTGSPVPVRVTRSLSPQGLARTVPAIGTASRQPQPQHQLQPRALSYIPTTTTISSPVRRQACSSSPGLGGPLVLAAGQSKAASPAGVAAAVQAKPMPPPPPTAPPTAPPGLGARTASSGPPGLSGAPQTPKQPLRMNTASSTGIATVRDHNRDVNLSATSVGTTPSTAPQGCAGVVSSKFPSVAPPSINMTTTMKPQSATPTPAARSRSAVVTASPVVTPVTVVAGAATPKASNQRTPLSQVASTPALASQHTTTLNPSFNGSCSTISYQRFNSTFVLPNQFPTTSSYKTGSFVAPVDIKTHTQITSATRNSYLPPPAPTPAVPTASLAFTKAAPAAATQPHSLQQQQQQQPQPLCTARAASLVNATISSSPTLPVPSVATLPPNNSVQGSSVPASGTMLPSRTPPPGLRFPSPTNKQAVAGAGSRINMINGAANMGGFASTGGQAVSLQMQLGPPPISPQRSAA